jgi:predicted site-specific integrase-resolvase
MSPSPNPNWMRTPEVTAYACISTRTLKRLVREGKIGVLKLAGVDKTMYCRADVEALVAQGTRPAKVEAQSESMAGV